VDASSSAGVEVSYTTWDNFTNQRIFSKKMLDDNLVPENVILRTAVDAMTNDLIVMLGYRASVLKVACHHTYTVPKNWWSHLVLTSFLRHFFTADVVEKDFVSYHTAKVCPHRARTPQSSHINFLKVEGVGTFQLGPEK
jgi:hypothetical protein